MAVKCFVVALDIEGKKHYLEREEVGFLDIGAKKVKREATGFFTTDLKQAKKFLDEWMAGYVASGYEGARVETIKTGEVLK